MQQTLLILPEKLLMSLKNKEKKRKSWQKTKQSKHFEVTKCDRFACKNYLQLFEEFVIVLLPCLYKQ